MPVSTGMGRPICLIAVAAMAAALLPGSAPAENASPYGIGGECEANAVVPSRTMLVVGNSDSPYTEIVPRGGDSVITMWSVEAGRELASLPLRLEVYEPSGEPGEYKKSGESRMETVGPFLGNVFQTRIPVEGGEHVGLYGPQGTFVCTGEEKAVSLRSEGGGEIGETRLFTTETEIGTPVGARVEPDRDGDGFGDQTQDRCHETASRGSDCPIGVSVTHVEVRRRAILLEVVPQAFARIKARGEFLWYAPAERSGEQRRLVGTDRDTKRRPVAMNSPATFRIPLPKQVLQRLQRLRPGKSTIARVDIFLTDRDGWRSEERMRIAIWGRR